MKKVLGIALIAAFAVPSFQACKKGEDDPGLSLRSRKARLAGEWTLASMERNSEEENTYTDPNASNPGDVIGRTNTTSLTWDGSAYSSSTTETVEYDNGDETKSEYTVSNGVATSKDTYSPTSGSTISSSSSNPYTGSFEGTMKIEKDGSFEYTWVETTEVVDTNSNSSYETKETRTEERTRTVKGSWSWLDEDKVNDIANKERVAFFAYEDSDVEVTTIDQEYTAKSGGNAPADRKEVETVDWSGVGTPDGPFMIWTITMLKNKELAIQMNYDWDNTRVTTTEVTISGSTVTSKSTMTSEGSGTGTQTWTQN
jgi:hypothetical protein